MRDMRALAALGSLSALAAAGQLLAGPEDAVVSAGFRTAVEKHDFGATDADHAGIWKAATPRGGSMHGEFANNDPLGLAAGVAIWADCSINWTDPDSGRRYCFSSATSLVVFLESPRSYLARAVAGWSLLAAAGHGPPS
jgi:hypothetical protein